MSMTDQELAKHLGRALEASGIVRGTALAIRAILYEELDEPFEDDSEFLRELEFALDTMRDELMCCFAAISGPLSLEGKTQPEGRAPDGTRIPG